MFAINKNINILLANNNGFVTLVSVLIASAIGISVAVSLLLLGLGYSRTSLALIHSNQAKALANACVEEGLQQIRTSSAFVGTSSLILDTGACTYVVTNQGGNNRTITGQGTVGAVTRKTKATINTLSPKIIVNYWQELADF